MSSLKTKKLEKYDRSTMINRQMNIKYDETTETIVGSTFKVYNMFGYGVLDKIVCGLCELNYCG